MRGGIYRSRFVAPPPSQRLFGVLSKVASGINADLSVTEADDTLAITTAIELRGSLAITEADDVPSLAGTVEIIAPLAVTEGDDALTAAGEHGLHGTLDVTEKDDIFSATALMPIWYPRRGGVDGREEFERWQREWRESLRWVIERSFLIADGIIDPVTFEIIPPPDHTPVIDALLSQTLSLDRRRVEDFIAERKRLQEDDAMAILLLAA